MPVIVYRLLEYSLNDVLSKEYGEEAANDLFRKAGYLAGSEFAGNVLDLSLPLNEFFSPLQSKVAELQIGILRIESFDESTGDITLTVAEDLDCSGLPPTNEVVCNYDEGFISGILGQYTQTVYHVRETDCWANGARVCRFRGSVETNEP